MQNFMLQATLVADTVDRSASDVAVASGILLLMDSLLVVDPVLVAAVLDLVERSGECVEKARVRSVYMYRMQDQEWGKNVRADDAQDESSPGKIARVVLSVVRSRDGA